MDVNAQMDVDAGMDELINGCERWSEWMDVNARGDVDAGMNELTNG